MCLTRKTLRHWRAEHQYASLEYLAESAKFLLDLNRSRQQTKKINDKQPNYGSVRRNVKAPNWLVKILERSSPRRGGRRKSSSSSEVPALRRSGMSTRIIVATSEPGDSNLDNTTSTDSTSLCRVCMHPGHKKASCRQITSLKIFLNTRNKNFQTIVQVIGELNSPSRRLSKNPKQVKMIGEEHEVESCLDIEVVNVTATEARRVRQRCKLKAKDYNRTFIC